MDVVCRTEVWSPKELDKWLYIQICMALQPNMTFSRDVSATPIPFHLARPPQERSRRHPQALLSAFQTLNTKFRQPKLATFSGMPEFHN